MAFFKRLKVIIILAAAMAVGLAGAVRASETLDGKPLLNEPGALYVSEGNIFQYSLKSKIIEDSGWVDMKVTQEPGEKEKRAFVDNYMESNPEIIRDEVKVIIFELVEKKGSWHIRIVGFEKKLTEADKPEELES